MAHIFSEKKLPLIPCLLLSLASCLLCTGICSLLLSRQYEQEQFLLLDRVCTRISESMPEAENQILQAVKAESAYQASSLRTRSASRIFSSAKPSSASRTAFSPSGFLTARGYRASHFAGSSHSFLLFSSAAALLPGLLLFPAALLLMHRIHQRRLRSLTAYLERVRSGEGGLFLPSRVGFRENSREKYRNNSRNHFRQSSLEDEASRLEDELYKTVTSLYQTREEACRARENFARNLSHIAHQLKTPVTSIGLAVQLLPQSPDGLQCAERIHRQLARLTHLEESLLLLARIDAGTFSLSPAPTDVFTLLSMASDQLQELAQWHEVTIDLKEAGAVSLLLDPDWTMEALMNLMKNCLEYAPPGSAVHCDYEENPLYTRIRIHDEGPGFAPGDLPHLFERFYRGRQLPQGGHLPRERRAADRPTDGRPPHTPEGIGIGLPLARSIVEMQNGILTACSLPRGACFEIRFYRH